MDLDGPAPYEPDHLDVSAFDCGSEAQTRWLRQVARTAEAAGTARVYVVTRAGSPQVVGYHALAAAAVSHVDAPPALLKSAGRSPVPIILLARLGVDLTTQGQGLGTALVKDAMLRASQAAQIVGARAFVIHAESEQARAFYLHLAEFDVSPTDPLHLMLLMSEIARIPALDEADPDPRNVTDLLDRIDGAWEDALRGTAEADAGEGTPLEEL